MKRPISSNPESKAIFVPVEQKSNDDVTKESVKKISATEYPSFDQFVSACNDTDKILKALDHEKESEGIETPLIAQPTIQKKPSLSKLITSITGIHDNSNFLKPIVQSLTEAGYGTLEDLKTLDQKELNRFSFTNLHINRWNEYFKNTPTLDVEKESPDSGLVKESTLSAQFSRFLFMKQKLNVKTAVGGVLSFGAAATFGPTILNQIVKYGLPHERQLMKEPFLEAKSSSKMLPLTEDNSSALNKAYVDYCRDAFLKLNPSTTKLEGSEQPVRKLYSQSICFCDENNKTEYLFDCVEIKINELLMDTTYDIPGQKQKQKQKLVSYYMKKIKDVDTTKAIETLSEQLGKFATSGEDELFYTCDQAPWSLNNKLKHKYNAKCASKLSETMEVIEDDNK